MQNSKGFTLIELMVVVAIIGILAAIAIPQFGPYRTRAKLSEGYALAGPVQKDVVEYYGHRGELPPDNQACGQPAPELIKGKYVSHIVVEKGVISIHYDPDQVDCQPGFIELQPLIAEQGPTPVINWRQTECSS